MFASSPILKEIISQPFKRSQLGLFHGKMKQYGNNVPFSKHKTRRTWMPNIQNKRFFSDALKGFIQVKVTTKALKTIKKYGGIDQYVLKTKPELLGWEGMRLRIMVRGLLRENPVAATTVTNAATAPVPTTTTTAATATA